MVTPALARRFASLGIALALAMVTVLLAAAGPATAPAPERESVRWEQRSRLVTPRDDFATVVVDGKIWALGGMTGDRGDRLASTEVYDPATDTWQPGPPLPEGLAALAGVAVGDTIYLFGGLNPQSRPTTFAAALDTTTGQWRRLPPMPVPRYAHDAAVLDGKIYVMGGEAPRQVDVFDPATGTWSSAAPMPTARDGLRAVAMDGRIFALGGWVGDGPSRLVEVYDPATDSWQPGPRLPAPMNRFAAGVMGGQLWVTHHEDTFALDPRTGRWTAAPPMPTSRHGQGSGVIDGRWYVVGGCTPEPLRDVAVNEVLVAAPAGSWKQSAVLLAGVALGVAVLAVGATALWVRRRRDAT